MRRIINGTAMCGKVRIDKVIKLATNKPLKGSLTGKK